MPYKSGEEPAVGDIVEAAVSFDGLFDKIIQGDVYKVVKLSACKDVTLRGQQAPWDQNKFNLITR